MKASWKAQLSAFINHLHRRRPAPHLPPGEMIELDVEERRDRLFLFDLAARHGPIFKGKLEGQLGICIVGLALGKRFLMEHAAGVQASNIDISRVVSAGFMRQMQGETHRHYRRMVMAALVPGGFVVDDRMIRQITARTIRSYADARDFSPESWQRALHSLLTRVLVQLLTGFDPESATGQKIVDLHQKLGPHGLVWNLTDIQFTHFAEIQTLLECEIESGQIASTCLLGRLISQPGFDSIMLGNLIYMTEMGRNDMQTFFRWLSRYAALHQEALQLAASSALRGDGSRMRSFVLEVLRTNQSDRLMRRCLADIEFEGYLFPRDSIIRVCMWESHQNTDIFAAPLRFQPDRFITGKIDHERFSPFGLDRHQCPFGELVIRLASTFLETLATIELRAIGDGPSIRGAYFWEPQPSFTLEMGGEMVGEPG